MSPDIASILDSLPTFGPDAFPAGVTFRYRPALRGAPRLAMANRALRSYRSGLILRDVSHDATAGWSAVSRTVRDIVARPLPRETNADLARSIRHRSYRNAAARRAAARLNPANVGIVAAAEKATLAYVAQAFRYRLVRLRAVS